MQISPISSEKRLAISTRGEGGTYEHIPRAVARYFSTQFYFCNKIKKKRKKKRRGMFIDISK